MFDIAGKIILNGATLIAGPLAEAAEGAGAVARGVEAAEAAAEAAEQASVTFGRDANQVEHGFRHTDELGLSRADVQDAIRQHLPSVANKIPNGRPLNQVIEVGGQRIQYSAFRLPDGSINVGRIHGAP